MSYKSNIIYSSACAHTLGHSYRPASLRVISELVVQAGVYKSQVRNAAQDRTHIRAQIKLLENNLLAQFVILGPH